MRPWWPLLLVVGCGARGALSPLLVERRPSEPLEVAPVDARVWYARAVLAAARGDAAEVERATTWVVRLDRSVHGRLAAGRVRLRSGDVAGAAALIGPADPHLPLAGELRARLLAARGHPDAVPALVDAAAANPSLWPDALAAGEACGRADEVLDAWLATPAPGHARRERARAAARHGRHGAAAAEAAEGMAWVPTPELLALWATSAAVDCGLAPVRSWVVAHRPARFGPAWTEPLALVERLTSRGCDTR